MSTTHAELTTGTDDSSASITLVLSGDSGRFEQNREQLDWQASQLSLTVSTPFDGENDAMPATLNGLANGTTATLRWGQFSGATRMGLSADARKIYEEAKGICITKAGADQKAVQKCNMTPSSKIVRNHLPGKLAQYMNAQVPGGALDWGIEGSLGYRSFDYFDPTSLAKQDESKIQGGAKLFFAYYPKPAGIAITGSVAYDLSYKAQEETTLCPVASGPGPVPCVTGSPGAPGRDEGLLLSLGVKARFFGRGGALPLAVAPLVTYDALDEVWGVDVPVYFFTDGKTGLNGGLRGGWRSDDKKVRFGVFIGGAFSLFQ